MTFVKRFKIDLENGLRLENCEDRDKYIFEILNYYSDSFVFNDKEEVLGLFDKIHLMIEYDYLTATFNISNMPKLIGYNLSNKQKKNMICYYNICVILGFIIYSIFDREGNIITSISEGSTGAVSTAEMFKEAYLSLRESKLNNKKSYGATLLFITLFERSLKEILRLNNIKLSLLKFEKNLSDGSIKLNDSDRDLYFKLRFEVGIDKDNLSSNLYDGNMVIRTLAYNLFQKYGIIESCPFYKGIYEVEFITLNCLINDRYIEEYVDIRFLRIMKILFGTKKLNLRNNLAHCNNSYEDYYSIYITALLYKMNAMLLNGQITN